MINQKKWISSLPKINSKYDEEVVQVDHSRWTNTIPIKSTYNNVGWKYSLVMVLFVCGLLFVSTVKNKTRNIEKEINNLKASNKLIQFNLNQAILDNEVITSPENIFQLAEEHLESNLVSYKKSQIRELNEDTEAISKLNKKDKNLSSKIKSVITKKIAKKKTEIRKLQELYSKPEKLPGEIRIQIVKRIETKKNELKELSSDPFSLIKSQKTQKWVGLQIVKAFLGIPIVPGR